MAECALLKSSQCFQDKNRIKKDLTKWTKNILLLVGLERVAQELMGGRRWRKLTASFNSLEPDQVQDWIPQEICYFCSSDKHDSNQNEILRHNDDCPLFTFTPGALIAATAATTSTPPPLICSCIPPQPTSIVNGSDTLSVLAGSISLPTTPANPINALANVSTEQPLDLSTHSRSKRGNGSEESNHINENSSLLRVPQPVQTNAKQGKKNRLESSSTWKRAYTEEELQQALNDIQSGKLGTRRAAVIYGIPRSTLRNKVYKLSSDRANGKRGSNSTAAATSATAGATSLTATKAALSTNLPASAAVVAAAAAAAAGAKLVSGRKSIPETTNEIKNKTLAGSRKSLSVKNNETETREQPNNLNNSSINFSNHNNNNLIPNDLKQFLKRTITQKVANTTSKKSYNNSSPEVDPSFLSSPFPESDSKETEASNLLGSTFANIFSDPLTTFRMLSSLDCGNSIGPLISQILLNVHSFPWNNNNNNNANLINNKPTENMDLNNSLSGTLPLLPELIRKLAQERLEVERLSNLSEQTASDLSEGNCDSKVILKVPSYQPKSNPEGIIKTNDDNNNLTKPIISSNRNNLGAFNSGSFVNTVSSHSQSDVNANLIKDENGGITNTTREEPMLNERKFNLFPGNSDESSSDVLINENTINSNSNNSNTSSTRRKGEKRNPTNSATSDQSAPSTPDPKRNRPKRGRYRNYKRDDLARAVRAVQMGEMSVHRAGTHYGVPHSTLEYKVKERHLLRPKKRQTNSSSSSSSSAASLIKKDDGKSLILPKINSLEPTTTITNSGSPEQALNLGLLGSVPGLSPSPSPASQINQASSLWQTALPLFPVDFGTAQNSTNFFASNMMRKLKENAQLHEETNNNNSNGSVTNPVASNINDTVSTGSGGLKEREFGSLLLETLIKSSLEKKMLNSMSPASDSDSRTTRNSANQQETGDTSDGSKYNASLAALKEVTSMDSRKE